jgi:hypothetical protein
VLSSAALLGDASGGAQWRSCLANLQRFVTDQLTGPFIQHLEVPGQATPGLTFEVGEVQGFDARVNRVCGLGWGFVVIWRPGVLDHVCSGANMQCQ